MLDEKKIAKLLCDAGITVPKIFKYDTTDSTNTRARAWAGENPENKSPTVFIASEQTAGRGRRGRSFVSNRGAGIYISFLIYPDISENLPTKITAKAAVALARAVEAVSPVSPLIKWVNDLYASNKKLAGILTEGEYDENGNLRYIVCGMGINVYKNALTPDISNIATSIEHESGIAIDLDFLASNIISQFLYGTGDCYSEYKSRSFVIGNTVTVLKPCECYEATAIDVDEDYSLIVRLENGKIEKLFTGEISIKI